MAAVAAAVAAAALIFFFVGVDKKKKKQLINVERVRDEKETAKYIRNAVFSVKKKCEIIIKKATNG